MNTDLLSPDEYMDLLVQRADEENARIRAEREALPSPKIKETT